VLFVGDKVCGTRLARMGESLLAAASQGRCPEYGVRSRPPGHRVRKGKEGRIEMGEDERCMGLHGTAWTADTPVLLNQTCARIHRNAVQRVTTA
jgi:hypothetical protein